MVKVQPIFLMRAKQLAGIRTFTINVQISFVVLLSFLVWRKIQRILTKLSCESYK